MINQSVTLFGRFLRKTKLDELPQLVNILVGDMSFVGPRPTLPEYVAWFPEEFEPTLQIKPGLFSYASISYFNEEDLLANQAEPLTYYKTQILPEKLKLDTRLVTSFSIKVYFQLLFLGIARSLGLRFPKTLLTFAP